MNALILTIACLMPLQEMRTAQPCGRAVAMLMGVSGSSPRITYPAHGRPEVGIVASSALFCLIPPPALTDTTDIVEVNHLYSCNCRLVFSQAIWLDDTPDGEQVVAWRIIRNGQPMPVKESTGYVCRWNDKDGLRVVTAKRRRETWTHHDPEILHREVLPVAMRRGLIK